MNAILTKNATVVVMLGRQLCFASLDHKAGSCVLSGGHGAVECLMLESLNVACLGLPGLVSMFEDN